MSAENKTPPGNDDLTTAKLKVIEQIVVDQVDQIESMGLQISDLQKAQSNGKQVQYPPHAAGTNEAVPPVIPTEENIYHSTDPEVSKAKHYIAKVDAGVLDKQEDRYFNAVALVNRDLLSRCVFELDGCKYKFTSTAVKIRGQRVTAPEAMKDTRLLRFLIKSGGTVVPNS